MLWRTKTPSSESGRSTFVILGAMPDGRLLVRTRVHAEGAGAEAAYQLLDAKTGTYEVAPSIGQGIHAYGAVIWVKLMADGYLLCLGAEGDAWQPGDIVKLDFDHQEQWRVDTGDWGGTERWIGGLVLEDGSVLLYGSADTGFGSTEAVTGVRKLSPDGELIWKWEETIDGLSGSMSIEGTPDGGALVGRGRSYKDGKTEGSRQEMIRLDKSGNAVWTKDGGSICLYAVLADGNIVARNAYPGDGSGLVLYDENLNLLAEHIFGEIDGRVPIIWIQFSKDSDGTMYVAGDIGTASPENSEAEELLFGVVYGTLDETFWE